MKPNGNFLKVEEILMKKPSKNPDLKIKCIYEGDIAIITYPKNFGPIEKISKFP